MLFRSVSQSRYPTNGVFESLLRTILTGNQNLWEMRSNFGNAPLHDAIVYGYSIGNLLSIVKKLKIPNYQNVVTKTGRSALHVAAALNNEQVVKVLLEHNTDPYIIRWWNGHPFVHDYFESILIWDTIIVIELPSIGGIRGRIHQR